MYKLDHLIKALEILSHVDIEDEELDQIAEVVVIDAEEKLALEKILDLEEEGEIDEEEADAALAQAIIEHAEKKLDVFNLQIDLVEQPEENYSQSQENLISFSQAFGATISELIAEDYTNPEIGKQAIAQATGLSLDNINSIILGQAVPDKSTANAMTACFSATTSADGRNEFMNLVSQAQEEVEGIANFGAADPKIAQNTTQLEQLQGQIDELKAKDELGKSLRSLQLEADKLIQNGSLTPYEKQALFGANIDPEEGLALFSATCQTNNVSTDQQLDRIEFYLHVAGGRGQAIQFRQPQGTELITNNVSDPAADEYADGFIRRNGIV